MEVIVNDMRFLIFVIFVALLAGCAYVLPFPNCPTGDFYEYLSCTQPRHYDAEEPTEERLQELAELLESYCVEEPEVLLPILDNAIIDVVPAAQATMRGEGIWAKRYEFEGRPGRLLKGDHFRAVLDAYLLFLEHYEGQIPNRTANDFCVDLIESVDERIVTLLMHRPPKP